MWWDRNDVPPMQNEPNQDAIDAAQAAKFRKALAEQGITVSSADEFKELYKSVDEFEKFLKS